MVKTIHYANEYKIHEWYNNIAERKIQIKDIEINSLINIYKSFIEEYKHENDWRKHPDDITPALQESITIIDKYIIERLTN